MASLFSIRPESFEFEFDLAPWDAIYNVVALTGSQNAHPIAGIREALIRRAL